MWGIELMRLLNTEAKMEELDTYRMRDGGVLVLAFNEMRGMYSVAYYSRADIEEWVQEYAELNSAREQFELRKRADRGPKGVDKKTGAKR